MSSEDSYSNQNILRQLHKIFNIISMTWAEILDEDRIIVLFIVLQTLTNYVLYCAHNIDRRVDRIFEYMFR